MASEQRVGLLAESVNSGGGGGGGGGASAPAAAAPAGHLTPAIYVCALLGSAGAAQYGLNVGVVNAPQAAIKADLALSTLDVSLVVSAFAIAGWAGATLTPRFVDAWGRRPFLIFLQWIFVLGGVLCGAVAFLKGSQPALAFGLLMTARCCFGAGAGAASVAVPMYLGEIAPAALKGAFGALNQFSLVVLILVGQFMSLGMSGSDLWPWLFASSGVLGGVVILASGPLLLESPRWLVAQGRSDEARKVLLACRGYGEADADAEIGEILEDSAGSGAPGPAGAEEGAASAPAAAKAAPMSMVQLLATPSLRAPLLVAVMLQLTQQFSGINAVFFYSTSFFEAAVASPGAASGSAPSDTSKLVGVWGTIATGFINVLATAASIPLIERAGRKPLLLWACGGMLACSCLLTGVLAVKDLVPAFSKTFGSLSIVFVLVYVCFFEVGLGAIPWSIGGELFPEDSRATAMGFAAAANWLGTTLVGFGFPYLQELLGNYSFVPFAVWLLIGLLFTIFYVPETKGRSPAELLRWFARGGNAAERAAAGGADTYELVKGADEE